MAPKGRSPSPPRRGKRTRSQTSNLYEQDSKAERRGKSKTKKIKPNKTTKAPKRGRKKTEKSMYPMIKMKRKTAQSVINQKRKMKIGFVAIYVHSGFINNVHI